MWKSLNNDLFYTLCKLCSEKALSLCQWKSGQYGNQINEITRQIYKYKHVQYIYQDKYALKEVTGFIVLRVVFLSPLPPQKMEWEAFQNMTGYDLRWETIEMNMKCTK